MKEHTWQVSWCVYAVVVFICYRWLFFRAKLAAQRVLCANFQGPSALFKNLFLEYACAQKNKKQFIIISLFKKTYNLEYSADVHTRTDINIDFRNFENHTHDLDWCKHHEQRDHHETLLLIFDHHYHASSSYWRNMCAAWSLDCRSVWP